MSSPPVPVDRRRTAGFALLEVLVAVAVAAVLMTALMKAFATTWSGIATVRQEVEAMLVARAVLSATGSRGNLADTTQDGVIGTYKWALTVEQVPTPGIFPTGSNAAAAANSANAENPSPWKLYRILIVITALNGRRSNLDTFRLGRQTP